MCLTQRRSMITQKVVKDMFDYRRDGVLLWGKNRGAYAGRVAGFNAARGYRQITVKGRKYLLHRLIWLWHEGTWPCGVIDHINQDNKDNRIENLRDVEMSINSQNCKVAKNTNTGISGVTWRESHSGYNAAITIGGKSRHLAFSKDIVEAASHRYAAEQCLDYGAREVRSSAGAFIEEYVSEKQKNDVSDLFFSDMPNKRFTYDKKSGSVSLGLGESFESEVKKYLKRGLCRETAEIMAAPWVENFAGRTIGSTTQPLLHEERAVGYRYSNK